MAVAALVTITGCYSPALRDCSVSCTSQGDCAGDQVCGGDGMCASPARAGHCGPAPLDAQIEHDADILHDAGVLHDGPAVDAESPDAATTIALRVQIIGKGSVAVDGHGVCSSADPSHGDCTYAVALRVAQSVHAVPIQPDQMFGSWSSITCGGQGATCTFTPVAATNIAAKFVK